MTNILDSIELAVFVLIPCYGQQWYPKNSIAPDWAYFRMEQGVESVPAYIDTNGLNAGFHRLWYRSNYRGMYYCEVMAPDGQIRDRYFVWYDWGKLPDGAEVIVILDAAQYSDWLAQQGFS